MRVDKQFAGVVKIDKSRSPGGARGLNSEQGEEYQQKQVGESSTRPGSDETDQGNAGTDRADQRQKEGAGGLQLEEFFALEGWVVAQDGAKQAAKSKQEDRQQNRHKPAKALAQLLPVEMLDQVAKRPASGEDHRHGDVGCEPGHAFTSDGKSQQAHDRPVD